MVCAHHPIQVRLLCGTVVGLLALSPTAVAQSPLGTAISYQGQSGPAVSRSTAASRFALSSTTPPPPAT